MLTATSAVVSGATLSSSKWYKDDVEIPGATGLQFVQQISHISMKRSKLIRLELNCSQV